MIYKCTIQCVDKIQSEKVPDILHYIKDVILYNIYPCRK